MHDEGISAALEDFKPIVAPDPGIWETKDGRCIEHKDLEDSHLLDIVAMLERKFKPDGFHAMIFGLSELKAEVAKRGLQRRA